MDNSEVIEFLRETADDGLENMVFDDPAAEIRFLIGRNKNPFLRNLCRPIGEFYAVVTYDQNHVLKLVKKPKWGGYVICLVMWDIIIIDIDDRKNYRDAKEQLLNAYPDDLFYTHRTPRGYHIYLMSRLLECYDMDALFMRMLGYCDPAHATNSMYSGTSIRVCRKPNDVCAPSVFYEKFGGGQIDPDVQKRYDLCLKYLTLFSSFYTDKLLATREAAEVIIDLHSELLRRVAPDDFGLHHVLSMAPFKLELGTGLAIVHNQKYCTRDPKIVWHELCEKRDFPHDERHEIIASVHRKIQMRNLYRILDSTADYAMGVHIQESLYFISYRELLMVDYDTFEDLETLRSYVAKSAQPLVFRVVKTKRGHHCFLTSKRVPFNSDEAYWILKETNSDLFHSLGSMIRGYSVRLNQKHAEGDIYEEVEIIRSSGGEEDLELVRLYKLHLELYTKYSQPTYCTYNTGKNNATKLFDLAA